ncbi:MAG: hypothetical protein EAZ53_11075 [Bacteroidetes bacterium]|nr:MAG: hypothetical protein EAZ53_11075 [Bacteroidota bacterium]
MLEILVKSESKETNDKVLNFLKESNIEFTSKNIHPLEKWIQEGRDSGLHSAEETKLFYESFK